MRAVAKQVGVSATALYRHFDDKEALIRAIVADGRDRFAARVFGALSGQDPRDRLRRTGLAYLGFALDEPEHFRVFFLSGAVGTAPVEPSGGLPGRAPPTRQFLLDRLYECSAAGLLTEPDAIESIALFLWAEVHGLAVMWVAGGLDQVVTRQAFETLATECVDRAVDAILV